MKALPALVIALLTASCGGIVADSREVASLTTPGVRGRDGGASVRVGDQSVWIFGDSFLTNADGDGLTLRSNTFFTTTDLDASDGLAPLTELVDEGGAPRFFIEPTAEERVFNVDNAPARKAGWPGTSVLVNAADAVGPRVLTFFGLIDAAPGEFNFSGTGSGIAQWTTLDPAPDVERHVLWDIDEPAFASAAAIDDREGGDGALYAFACDGQAFGACVLGRVDVDRALERAAWTYWDGSAFVAELASAKSVVEAAPIATLFKRGGRWALVYSAVFSSDVVMRTADAITGPWSVPETLFTGDHGDDNAVYDAYVHPELSDDEDTLFVSYTRNTEPFASVTVLVEVSLR